MDSMTYVAATGMLGAGFRTASLEASLSREPAFVGCDAGSNDGGPTQLATGSPIFGRTACIRDLRELLRFTQGAGIPLLIGSCGGGGIDAGVDATADMVRETAAERGLRFRMARIYAEPERQLLKKRYAAGRIRPLPGAPEIDEGVWERSEHTVAMMGVEPFQTALAARADVVLAGRSSDTSIYSAIPIQHGFDGGLVWHAAKLMEGGCASASDWSTRGGSMDSMLCTLSDNSFVMEPLNPDLSCTPVSVAAHTLYENADPFKLIEPSGTLDTTDARYEALDNRRVRVSGSRFIPAETYTVLLEGAELAGYSSFMLASVRDPIILRQLDSWIEEMVEMICDRNQREYGLSADSDYQLILRVYGKNGTLGRLEPTPVFEGHEAVIFMEIVAPSDELAKTLIRASTHVAEHLSVPEWSGSMTGIAHPFTPMQIDRGPIFKFNLHHVMELDSPTEPYRIEYEEVG